MARKVFFSFHYDGDSQRASQVRNMGVLEGNQTVSDNDWETVKKGGDKAIQTWIDNQFAGRSCALVLVGAGTAGRKWINYEIQKAWDSGKGLLGIRIHGLKNLAGQTSYAGNNPFDGFNVAGKSLSSIVNLHTPSGFDSKGVYDNIKTNIDSWVETAIEIRKKY
ncbi:TIR domain-containing protein [Caulobacter vibrioides]|uniref:Thoeris protein ThsB TIR-like domain-containing protein n=1 Tax=Caulobacter vibrioides OR37 TaxID=1292034 RepID=R0D3S1_CAUVI|nr:TIR domain-containing protein [Caulobacter vibrioides]ENZ83251.1 hypothetical protein OR37_01027 [Caulobacter vibrioides OR37]